MSINFDTYSFTFLASQLEVNKILFVIIACILEKKKRQSQARISSQFENSWYHDNTDRIT